MPSKPIQAQSIDMQALADLAGVSRSTVSRALNDSPLINEQTKTKIRELALKHHFVMNQTARSLRLRKTNVVCVVLMHDAELSGHLSDPFFLRMVGSVTDSLAAFGYDMMLYHKPIESAKEFLTSRVYRHCDGAIFIGQGTIHNELNELAGYQKPFLVWGADLPKREYNVVGSDNIDGGAIVTRHLLEQGCRRIAFFGDTKKPELALRQHGYSRSLSNAGIDVDPNLELALPMERGAADKLINKFIQQRPDIDGIVCCSDMLAASAISCLQRHGISVPQQVAVTGYDDLEIGTRIHPTVTTVSQNIQGAGALLVERLMELLAGQSVSDVVRPSSLVIRESSQRQPLN